RHVAVHQVRDDLGIGVALELVALFLQPTAQRLVVLDDAVVHDRYVEPATIRDVRVRVVLGDASVRGPARVGDAGRRVGARLARTDFELGDPADRAHARHRAVHDRDAGRVVAAVFELPQAFDQ